MCKNNGRASGGCSAGRAGQVGELILQPLASPARKTTVTVVNLVEVEPGEEQDKGDDDGAADEKEI